MTGQSSSFSEVAQALSGKPSVKEHGGLMEEIQPRQDVLLKQEAQAGVRGLISPLP